MRKIKSFKLFESSDDTWDILSVVKDMLLELNFNDFQQNAVIRRMDGKEFIRITIYKPAIRNRYAPYRYIPHTRSWVPSIEDSFKWNDVKEVIVPVMNYLSEEGFEWFKNKGTFACYVGRTGILTGGNEPNVVSNGSAVTGEYKTRIEMWFLRI